MEPGINKIEMSKRTYLIFFLSVISLLVAGLLFFIYQDNHSTESLDAPKIVKQNNLHQAEPNEIEFYDTVYGFAKKNISFDKNKIVAGVAPHHLLAGDMIAEFYYNLSGLDIDTIVLLGPNHYNAGKSKIISSTYDWQTPFGNLECDRRLLDQLSSGIVGIGIEPGVVGGDHSMSSHAGFIKKTFGKARFLPLILSPNMNMNEAGALAKALLTLSEDRKILLIASVDFSHDKNSQTAMVRDQVSIEVMEKMKLGDVYTLNLDSPPSIYALMKYSEFKGASFKLLANSNSALLADKPKLENATSYVTGYFTKEKISMLFFGDMMLDRSVKDRINENGFDYLFEKLDDINFFNNYDIVSTNLEGTVTDNGEHYAPSMAYDFAFSPMQINSLKKYNFNFFTIANNHLSDQGKKGINETRNNLKSLGFEYVGCQDGVIDSCSTKKLEIKNKSVGMIGISAVYSDLDEDKLKNTIVDIKDLADIVVVNAHWGAEYKRDFDLKQQNLAHKIIDAGADIIIGHHPHVIQGIEVYRNKPIFYSLGNFIFDQYFSKETQEGLALEFNLEGNNIKINIYPIKSKLSQVQLMDENEKQDVFEDILKHSTLDSAYEEQIKKGYLNLHSIAN
ncbi:AmmeMemoRadiSam system protein B [Candidatus Parcubacteria bacterium]|nr:AmmeMemoRadiSam system protein B [Candidatus Parcubacteria bacterium]